MQNEQPNNAKSNSAVLRIVIWSVVALLLLGLLVAGLNGQLFRGVRAANLPGIYFNNSSNYSYANSELYTAGGGSVAAGDIHSINIEWVEGSVTVLPGAGDAISFSEESAYELEEQYKLHSFVQNGTLYIRYSASRSPLSLNRPLGKALTVVIPEAHQLASFDLEAVSGSVDVRAVQADDVVIEAVSGKMTIRDITAETMDVETVSGRTELSNLQVDMFSLEGVSGNVEITDSNIRDVTCEMVSGGMRVEPGAGVEQLDISTVSGGIRIGLPEMPGFTAQYTEGSGRFSSDFPVEMRGKRNAVYGDGSADFELSTLSGSIRIEKK